MKTYVTVLIPIIVLAIVFAGGFVAAPTLESPQSQLDRQVDEKVELAQRLLYQYNAAAPRLHQVLEMPTTQPVEVDPDSWRSYLELEENTPFASLRDRMLMKEQELRSAADQIANLGGSEGVPPSSSDAEQAYQNLLEDLKGGHALLDRAIGVARDAINLEAGTGEAAVSGRNNPNATRLEAILLWHQADLLRREGALVRAKAKLDRSRVDRLVVLSREVQDRIAAERMLLSGGTAPGKKAAARPAAPPPAKADAAAPTAETREPAKPAKPSGWWIFSGVAERIPKAPVQPPQPAEPVEPAPAPAPEVAVQPEVEEGPAEVVPALPERIAALQKNRAEVQARIQSEQARVDELAAQIQALNTKLTAAQEKARQAELQMIAAEQKGVSSSDSQAVQKFVNDYRKLAEENRQAAREAAALREGTVRNGRSASTDPDEILTSPVVAVDASKPMEPERGLTAIENDKAIAEVALKSNKELLAEVDRQIQDLNAQRESIESRLSGLQATAQKIASQLSQNAAAAAEAMVRAGELEAEAVASAQAGQTAAGNAQSAAQAFQTRTAAFIRSENPTEQQVRKLTEMAGDQFTSAHALAIGADLNYLLARTYVQQAIDLEQHRTMLAALAAFGVTVKLGGPQSSEGAAQPAEGQATDGEQPAGEATLPDMAAAATKPDAAGQLAAHARKEAADQAKQALEQYQQAATQAKDLWAMHANMAAVHALLADLPKADGDTEDHLALARQIYARAIQGREKRPEYVTYRQILESMKEAPAGGTN